jgi:hypothetical protein
MNPGIPLLPKITHFWIFQWPYFHLLLCHNLYYLYPIVANSLWNKIGLSSILYGSEIWYALTKTEAVMLDKLQIRKLKQMQKLALRTDDALVTAMVTQYSVMTIIEIRKKYFLCKLICSTGITKCIFVNRLYDDTILFISNKGFIPEICTILSKYDLTKYFLTYVYGGQFPTRMCWKAIVKQAVASNERDKCHTIISDKADVPRFLRIMTNRLYQKSFPFYVIAMKDYKYTKLLVCEVGLSSHKWYHKL